MEHQHHAARMVIITCPSVPTDPHLTNVGPAMYFDLPDDDIFYPIVCHCCQQQSLTYWWVDLRDAPDLYDHTSCQDCLGGSHSPACTTLTNGFGAIYRRRQEVADGTHATISPEP